MNTARFSRINSEGEERQGVTISTPELAMSRLESRFLTFLSPGFLSDGYIPVK